MFVDDRYVWVFFFLHQPGIFKSFESLKCTSVSCIKMLMDMFCVVFFFYANVSYFGKLCFWEISHNPMLLI